MASTRRPSPSIRALYGVLIASLLAYALSLVVRGPDGAAPTWLDGWGVAAFELLASVLVLARAYAIRRDRHYAIWLGLGCVAWALGDFAMTYETLGGATRRQAGDSVHVGDGGTQAVAAISTAMQEIRERVAAWRGTS